MLILLVDDQRSLRRSLALMLQNAGFQTDEASSGAQAISKIQKESFDLVITDIKMDGISGIELLKILKKSNQDLPVIVITAYGSIESAVDAMRIGAFDYLSKPFTESDIIEKIQASQLLRVAVSDVGGQTQNRENLLPERLVAGSPAMAATLIKAERVAQTDISVLITGETGTGKTRIARIIHEYSRRRAHPFISINCASLPEQLLESELFGHIRGSFTGAVDSRTGLFEDADKGTIFLDEVDTLSLSMQAKLLSVLQDKQIRRVGANKPKSIDTRLISASNQNMVALMEKGLFRSDLYFRINGLKINVPPLRDRGMDLKILLDAFIKIFSKRYDRPNISISQQAIAYVLAYPYPGNVRQLENFAEQMVAFANEEGVIDVDALPEEFLDEPVIPMAIVSREVEVNRGSLAGSERLAIEAAIARTGRIEDAAKELGIGRTTLWRKMRQYNIVRTPVTVRKRILAQEFGWQHDGKEL
jgi:DNA-binding NtrC family response regulator